MYKVFLLAVGALVIGCERQGFSPVEIKLDEGNGCTLQNEKDMTGAETYTVQDGETLFDVAYKFNIDPMNLAKENNIKHPYVVRDGRVLELPKETKPKLEVIEDFSTQSQPEDKEVPPSNKRAEEKTKKELDDEFSELFTTKFGKQAPAANGKSFNEQEKVLSSPKVTKTAVGTPIVTAKAEPKSSISTEKKEKPAAPAVSGKMLYPVDGKVISRFGDVVDGISNDGINIKAKTGTPVKAAADGEVIYCGNKLEELGNTVIVQHDNGLITSYSHLKDTKVKNGAEVKAGHVVGTVGQTGEVTEPQLHFEVLKNKTPVDPEKYLK